MKTKGSAIIVWCLDLIRQEALRQLSKIKLYCEVGKDLTQENQKLVSYNSLPSTASNLIDEII